MSRFTSRLLAPSNRPGDQRRRPLQEWAEDTKTRAARRPPYRMRSKRAGVSFNDLLDSRLRTQANELLVLLMAQVRRGVTAHGPDPLVLLKNGLWERVVNGELEPRDQRVLRLFIGPGVPDVCKEPRTPVEESS